MDQKRKTTMAMNMIKNFVIGQMMKLAVWNVRGLAHKEVELQKELHGTNIDIALIPETKKKLKGSTELENYIVLYSGVLQDRRASSGIAILVRREWKLKINSYTCG